MEVFCISADSRDRVPGAGQTAWDLLRWEEKLDRDMGIFMNQIIWDLNREKLLAFLN